jgi:hypothetical protein
MGHFLGSIVHVLGAIRLLVLAKSSGGIKLIAVAEVLCQLVNKVLCFQLWDVFSFHLSFHQFGVVIKGRCEVVVHIIRVVLNVHPDWVVLQVDVVNIFNFMLHKAIFQKLHAIRGQLSLFFLFVHFFYALAF